jgi:hypothetical protein
MDCRTAQLLAPFARPNCPEMDTETLGIWNAHVTSCPECAVAIANENRWDDLLSEQMRALPEAGQGLNRLNHELNRRVWNRRLQRSGSALAASLVVGFSILFWPRPEVISLDLEQFLVAQTQGDRRSEVETWLQRHHLAFRPKTPFQYERIVSFGMSDLQGKDVPMFYFWNAERRLHARVYLIRKNQFDFQQLLAERMSDPSTGTLVQFIPDAEIPETQGYLAITNSETLDPFLDLGNYL